MLVAAQVLVLGSLATLAARHEEPKVVPPGPARVSSPQASRKERALTQKELIDNLRRKLPVDQTLVHERSFPSVLPGVTVSHYLHFKKHLRVEGEGVWVRIKHGLVIKHGTRVSRLHTFSTRPVVTLAQAQTLARRAFTQAVGSSGPFTYAAGSPSCELIIVPAQRDRGKQLEYRCHVDTMSPAHAFLVAVSGSSPRHLWAIPRFVTSLANGRGYSLYVTDEVHFGADLDSAMVCRLRNPLVDTMDAGGAVPADWSLSTDYTVTSTGGTCNYEMNNLTAVGAHWLAESLVIQYETIIGPSALDGLPGNKVTQHLNAKKPPHLPPTLGLFHSESEHVFYFGAPDPGTVGHEVGHAFIHSAGFASGASFGEYGAINEGWADVWKAYGEILANNYAVYDAKRSGTPDVYGQGDWGDPNDLANDNGHIHKNGSIFTRAALFAAYSAEGTNSASTSYAIDGIDGPTMLKIFQAGIVEFQSGLGYVDLAGNTHYVASEMCGALSEAARSVNNAWYAVGVHNTEMPLPYFKPDRDQVGVQPWPARLSWREQSGGTSGGPWLIEYVENPDAPLATAFPSTWDPYAPNLNPGSFPVPGGTVSATDVEAGGIVGFAEYNLKPNTKYEWRVRSAYTDPSNDCWRPRGWFTTLDPVPVPLSPQTGSAHNPWKLPFTMQLAPNTQRVEIEVSRSPDPHDLVFPAKSFAVPTNAPDRTRFELTVPIRSELYWRARGHVMGAGSSSWSAWQPFLTTVPGVTLHSPVHNAPAVAPWRAELKWNPVHGAGRYHVRVSADPPDGVDRDGHVPGDRNHSFRAFDAEQLSPAHFKWKVVPKGPPFGSEDDPEPEATAEQGLVSSEWRFTIDKNATLVDLAAPIYDPSVKGCQASSVLVDWDPVPFATAYDLAIYPVYSNLATPPTDSVGLDPVLTMQAIDPSLAALTLTDASVLQPQHAHANHVGFHIGMQAFGPDGVRGARGDSATYAGRYYMRPSVPVTRFPTNAINWTPGWVRMLWETGLAPGGRFERQLFNGPGCMGSMQSAIVTANHWGASAVQTGPKPEGTTFSWTVRPAFAEHCSFALIAVSDCRSYTIPIQSSPAPCGFAFTQEDGGFTGMTQDYVLPSVNTDAFLVLNTLDIPDRITVTRGLDTVVDTGCVSSNATCPSACINAPGGVCRCPFNSGTNNDTVQVKVSTACGHASQANTKWAFQVVCPNDASGTTVTPPLPEP